MTKKRKRFWFEHVNEIKVGLGISGVLTEVHSWFTKADKSSGIKGAQIDMVIVRNDRIINLCEMKYSISEYSFTGKDDESLRNKIAALKTVCKTRYSFHPVLVTTYGLKEGMYSGRIQAVIKMDDLFHRI